MRIPNLVALLALGFATISPPSHAATAVAEHLRDTRYGEVLTVRQHGLDLSVKVYSTMGLNDCPEALWKDLNADRLAKQYRVKFVKLNGPRHWTLDRLEAWGGSRTGETETFGGIKMALRATIHASLLQGGLGSKKYAETIVKRDTVFTFDAGNPCTSWWTRPVRPTSCSPTPRSSSLA